mmetsp:Transcript_102479/g.176957  ORF Transcript_102479/g.176957 Transcript_102479/m.176957 type:complete len:94 (+) Transcript_102479:228-509(+)
MKDTNNLRQNVWCEVDWLPRIEAAMGFPQASMSVDVCGGICTVLLAIPCAVAETAFMLGLAELICTGHSSTPKNNPRALTQPGNAVLNMKAIP